MLKLMRDYAGSWIIKLILGAIVIVFVFWGVGSFRSQRNSRVAMVNGQPITMDEYRPAYNNMIEQYRRQFGNNLDDNMIKTLGIKQMALDRLIDQSLLRQEAAKLNFRISDNELANSIKSMAVFQTNGIFDNRLYTRVLSLNRLTPEIFESMQRDSLLIDRLRTFILDNVKVSDQEAMEWYQWNNASVDIDYVIFSPETYKDIEVLEDEIKQYFENNKESYKTEAKVKAKSLYFNPKDYIDKVTITDDDIKDYYDTNNSEFKEPKTVEARHILIKLDNESKPEEIEKKKEKANEILKMAQEGKDFAELAKKYSEGPSKDKGGYLGKFKKEAMVKPFADKAFSMKAGEISEPVKTRFGWHIIKVEKVNEASEKSLEEVKENIRKKIGDEKSKILAYDDAQALYDSAFEGDDLKQIADTKNMEVKETDFFTRKGPEGFSNPSKFASTAFSLDPMQLSEVQDFGDGYYILQVMEKIPQQLSKFEDVKEQVKADLIKDKQDKKAKDNAEKFLAALKNDSEMDAESKKNDLELKSTGFFKRNASIPNIGYERKITQEAFQLSKENKFPKSPIKGKKGYYIIGFKNKKLPEAKSFEPEKSNIKERLLRQKQYKTFDKWLAQIKDKSEISVEEDILN